MASLSRDRCRFRFSLRALFALMTVLCILLGWSYSRAMRQEQAVGAIERLGGSVEYDWQRSPDGSTRAAAHPRGPIWLRKVLGAHFFDAVVGVNVSRAPKNDLSSGFAPFRVHLRELPKLKRLHISRQNLIEADYATIGQLTGLEKLSLGAIVLSKAGAEEIAKLLNLRELNLHDVIVPTDALVQIKGLRKLQLLSVYCRHEDRDSNGAYSWNLSDYAIRDDALASLPSLTALTTLSLTFTQISDKGVAIIGELPQLECLEISSPRITNASIDRLTKLKRLSRLGISVCAMDNEGVARLAELPKLARLGISGPAIDNNCLQTIARLENLEWLDLGGQTIDELGMQHLESMRNLRYLDLQSTGVKTDCPAVQSLKRALPRCRIRQYYPSPSFR